MNNLIKTVTVEELDKEVVKAGQFITFCNVYEEKNGDINLGKNVNGIITYVHSDYMTIYTSNSDKVRISIQSIIDDEKRILGILDSAIVESNEEPENPPVEGGEEPDNPPIDNGDDTEDDTTEGGEDTGGETVEPETDGEDIETGGNNTVDNGADDAGNTW